MEPNTRRVGPDSQPTGSGLLDDVPVRPVLKAAMMCAARRAKWLEGQQRLSASEATFLVLYRRVLELEEENEMLRRLR